MAAPQYAYTVDCQKHGYPVLYLEPSSMWPIQHQGHSADPGQASQEFLHSHAGHKWEYLQWYAFHALIDDRNAEREKLMAWNALSA